MRRGPVIAALVVIAATAFAQRGGFQRDPGRDSKSFPTQGEFHFVRVEYTDLPAIPARFRLPLPQRPGDGMVDAGLAGL